MAAARVAGGETGAFLAVPLLGGLVVLCTYGLGVRLHSRVSGVIAAAFLATSPIFLFQIVQPMSDVPATTWWALATLLALSPLPHAAVAAGATAGLAVLTRPNLVLLAFAVALLSGSRAGASGDESRWHPRRVLAFAAGMAPAMGAMLALQWGLYGSPLSSGYGSLQNFFALTNVPLNVRGYALRLLTGETAVLCIAAVALLALPFALRRSEGLRPARLAALTALLVAIGVLASYLPYVAFPEWSYLRFLLPAFPVAFVLVSALLVTAMATLPPWMRGVLLAAAVVTACAVNITVAEREQAFNLRRYESRYRTTGRYLESSLPSNAVVFTVQHSASVLHYAAVPTVRWDLLRVDLDSVVARLRTLGHHPVIVVEDWEMSDLRARFPKSATARLDWTPRADVGSETRVRLFDPADRDESTTRHPTDRLP